MRLSAIVGASMTGKTRLAYRMARETGAYAVVCGDQYQIIGGFPICTGASDAIRFGRLAPKAQRLLYGALPGAAPAPMTPREFRWHVGQILASARGRPVIIDSLSDYYFPAMADLPVEIIGLRARGFPLRTALARMARGVAAGVLAEVRGDLARYGRDCWLARNSIVIRTLAPLVDGRTGLLGTGTHLLRVGPAVIREKQCALDLRRSVQWRAA